MAFNDGLHIGSIIASIFLASRIEENLNRRQANNVNNANDNHSPRLSENFEQQELRNHIEMRNYEETNKCFYFIQEGIKMY